VVIYLARFTPIPRSSQNNHQSSLLPQHKTIPRNLFQTTSSQRLARTPTLQLSPTHDLLINPNSRKCQRPINVIPNQHLDRGLRPTSTDTARTNSGATTARINRTHRVSRTLASGGTDRSITTIIGSAGAVAFGSLDTQAVRIGAAGEGVGAAVFGGAGEGARTGFTDAGCALRGGVRIGR
jgi:hypothetical protein